MSSTNQIVLFSVNTISRVVLLAVTIVAILTVYLWVYHADVVHSVDRKISNQHFQPYEDRLEHVRRLYRDKNYEEAAYYAEKYLADMQEVRLRHKVYPTKRRLLIMLIRSKIFLGKPQVAEALPYAEAWVASDERDLTALLTYEQVLKHIPGKEAELREAQSLLQYRFPGMSTPPAAAN
jgi:hypothetical protein